MKVAVIGAGSLGFTRTLIQDLLHVPEFRNIQISLTDSNKKNLEMITAVLKRDIAANRLPAVVSATTDRRTALKGADYVINCVRVGGLKAFQTDIDIPLKYGVDQCVGDTLCAGGIMYGQRGIAALLEFCKDIREVCRPDVLLLNYSNPNAMMTWAANTYGKVRTIGLCHGVQNGHKVLADVIELLVNKNRRPDSKSWKKVSVDEVHIVCAGINHQTWYTQVKYDGQDWCPRLLEGFEKHPKYCKTEKVRIDMLRRFGYFPTESNGHFSEYVSWYRKNGREIRKWIDLSNWINGETGGYLRVCTERRNWFKTDFPKIMKDDPWDLAESRRSNEHGSYIIEALETGRLYRGHFNAPNQGTITNLPSDAIIEAPGYIDANGVNMSKVGDLPLGCAAICMASISVQRLAVEAAVRGDVTLLKQAMMMDPLVGALCTVEAISQMTDEMLIAGSKWLPQYRSEIPKAKKRLAAAKPCGTRSVKGAARGKASSIEEVRRRQEARAEALKKSEVITTQE